MSTPTAAPRPAYRTVHDRVVRDRGPAASYECEVCGEPARHWALWAPPRWADPSPYTDDLGGYTPLCVRCHWAVDRGCVRCPHGPDRPTYPTGGRCAACKRAREAARRRARAAQVTG